MEACRIFVSCPTRKTKMKYKTEAIKSCYRSSGQKSSESWLKDIFEQYPKITSWKQKNSSWEPDKVNCFAEKNENIDSKILREFSSYLFGDLEQF